MTFLIVLSLISVALLGLIRIRWRIADYQKRRNFLVDYANKFKDLAANYFKGDREAAFAEYEWLVRQTPKAQRELGLVGIVGYIAPFRRYAVPDYQIIVNTVPEFQDGTVDRHTASKCLILLEYQVGEFDGILEDFRRAQFNPFKWLLEGVNFIITIPFILAYWAGLFGPTWLENVSSGLLARLITFIVTIIGLVSSVITITQGGDFMIELLRSWAPWI